MSESPRWTRMARPGWRAAAVAAALLVPLAAPAGAETRDLVVAPVHTRTITVTESRASDVVAPSRAEFRSETEGLPTSTEMGSWEVDGGNARLRFEGGHAAGRYTRFVATFVTPLSRRSVSPSLSATFVVDSVNDLGNPYRLEEKVRYRLAGGRWSRWFGFRLKVRKGTRFYVGGSEFVLVPPRRARAQFEWRLQAELRAPALLRGDYRVTLN